MVAKIESKAPMVLGIGAALAGVFLLLREKKPPLPEPPPNGVVVGLWDLPSGGNYWQLVLFNEVWGDSVRVGMHVPTDQPMILESLPDGWSLPLYIDIMIYELDVAPYNIVYKVHSAYGPDWPYYKEVFILEYGSYYYNVAKERFE